MLHHIAKYNFILQYDAMAVNMSDLLTTKQVQKLLQVDRTTVYRMRKDGRLSAVKLGHQWRFPAQQIRDFLDGSPLSLEGETPQTTSDNLPIYCFQSLYLCSAYCWHTSVIATLKRLFLN